MSRILCALRPIAALFVLVSASSIHAAGDPPPYARAFEQAFEPGWRVEIGDRSVAFKTFDAGRLKLPSGKIKACDPFVGMEHPPFTTPVPAGEFPVRLALLAGGDGDGRVAFARVDFSPEPVTRWEMALIEGQDIATLKPDEHFGYPVDAGTGSFVDGATAVEAAKRMAADENLSQSWIDAGDASGEVPDAPRFHAVIEIDAGNIIMFDSGWGDGVYASWFGYDAQGKLAALVTDFNIVDWDKAKW